MSFSFSYLYKYFFYFLFFFIVFVFLLAVYQILSNIANIGKNWRVLCKKIAAPCGYRYFYKPKSKPLTIVFLWVV